MTKHLTPLELSAIEDALYSWEGTITWAGVCDKVEALIGKSVTRQTLSGNSVIKRAYDQAKSRSSNVAPVTPSPSSLKIAADRISRLESEIAALKSENSKLIEKFLRWQYNAYIKGLTEAHLDKPLPIIDRERSDAPLRVVRRGRKGR
ncbi:hypothetical protein LT702_14105 [Pseudomonas syringae pv. syringae]|jgi:hypothetical protein|uniref:hypothetical protein n=1 Tax=Pseudomonas syringae TaxID=317 RepID=UPI00200A4E7E|nr:hypothetical protein [Pseudomonas syringae]MCK9752725.1 hypothetical protein [Pseudomonas syringae pv. syringae]